MTLSRRTVLSATSAMFLCGPTWSDTRDVKFLGAGKTGEDEHRLFGLTRRGEILFDIPLPARGHAAAAHPIKTEAVAFARRPGRFAMVLDCAQGAVRKTLVPPDGRHFYGHGAFSSDGAILLTTENDIDSGEGKIGIWLIIECRQAGRALQNRPRGAAVMEPVSVNQEVC